MNDYRDMNVVEKPNGMKVMIQRCFTSGKTRYLSEEEYKELYNKEMLSEC